MAATDYVIVSGMFGVYLAKEKKTKTNKMSTDRRVITDNEILGLFEFYLRKYCKDNNVDNVTIAKDGKKIFEATLLDTKKD